MFCGVFIAVIVPMFLVLVNLDCFRKARGVLSGLCMRKVERGEKCYTTKAMPPYTPTTLNIERCTTDLSLSLSVVRLF